MLPAAILSWSLVIGFSAHTQQSTIWFTLNAKSRFKWWKVPLWFTTWIYDFEQCTVAMFVSAILLERTLAVNHQFSSQQFLVDHLHSKGIHNKMHRQQFLHVIGQGYWMSLDKASLLLAQWDSKSSLKCNSIQLIHQHLVIICHWILPQEDLLNNNENKPMPMLDPYKNVHIEI